MWDPLNRINTRPQPGHASVRCACGMHYRPEREGQTKCPICLAQDQLKANALANYHAWRGHDKPLRVTRNVCARPACGKRYMPVSSGQKFCSQDCAQANRAERQAAKNRLREQRYS